MVKVLLFSICLLVTSVISVISVILANSVNSVDSINSDNSVFALQESRLQRLCGKESLSNSSFVFNSFYQLKLTKNLKPLSDYFLEDKYRFIEKDGVEVMNYDDVKKFVSKLFTKCSNETKISKKFSLEKLDKFYEMSLLRRGLSDIGIPYPSQSRLVYIKCCTFSLHFSKLLVREICSQIPWRASLALGHLRRQL